MSNFNNGGLGDGGLQKSKEKQYEANKKNFEEHHIDITEEWANVPDHLRRPEHKRKYTQLTYEELEKKIGDAMYSTEFGNPLSKEAEDSWKEFELAYPLVDTPEGWEANYRAKLDKKIPHGCYDISSPGMSISTGKGGYIDYLVAMKKAGLRYK